MAHWRIHVLGTDAALQVDRRAVALPDTIWTLLGCLLSAPNRSAKRSHLAYILWPDSDEDAARHCLATTLWRMKRRLPCLDRLLLTHHDRIELAFGPRVWIDALALERRAVMALSETSWLNNARNRNKLRLALQHYNGEFLSRQDSDPILIERERLRALYLDASFQLAFACAHHGEWQNALEISRSLCVVEPLREDAQRLLIEAYAACGNRALAIQQYKSLEKLLRRELAVTPMRETTEAIARIATDIRLAPPAPVDSNRQLLLELRQQVATTMALVDRALGQMPA